MIPRLIVAAVGIGCAVATMGCDRLAKLRRGAGADAAASAAPTVLAAPPTPQIRDGAIGFRETKANVSATLRGTSYEILFFDFLPSSKVMVGSAVQTTSETGFLKTSVDLSEPIARLSPKDAFNPTFKLDPKTKLGLDFGPQAKLSVDMAPLSTSFALTEAFKKAPTAPVTVGSRANAAPHSVLFVDLASTETIGPAKTVADIDWVALIEQQPPHEGKTCSGYRKSTDPTGSVDRTLTLRLVDHKVSVYEVRTGRPVTQKVFSAPNVCPAAGIGELKASASPDEERAWLRQLTASRR